MTDRDDMVRRISAALDHIGKHGNLREFAATDEERRTLISAATAQGLIAWNAELERHELSRIAHKWLAAFYHGRSPKPPR